MWQHATLKTNRHTHALLSTLSILSIDLHTSHPQSKHDTTFTVHSSSIHTAELPAPRRSSAKLSNEYCRRHRCMRAWPARAWPMLSPLGCHDKYVLKCTLSRRSRTHHRRRWPSRVCLALSTHDVECDGSVGQRGERWWPCGVLGEPVVQIVGARLEGGGWAKGPQCLCTGPSCFDLELVRVWHVLWESAKGIHVRLRRWSVVPAHALAR